MSAQTVNVIIQMVETLAVVGMAYYFGYQNGKATQWERNIMSKYDDASGSTGGAPTDVEQFIAAVLLAVTDGETDDVNKFPTNTRERLETIYEGVRA